MSSHVQKSISGENAFPSGEKQSFNTELEYRFYTFNSTELLNGFNLCPYETLMTILLYIILFHVF